MHSGARHPSPTHLDWRIHTPVRAAMESISTALLQIGYQTPAARHGGLDKRMHHSRFFSTKRLNVSRNQLRATVPQRRA